MGEHEARAIDRRGPALAALVASLMWIGALASAPIVAARHEAAPHWQRVPAALVYLGASVICHQRPERSYHPGGVPLPVCARCTGLHLGATLGLLAFVVAPRASRMRLLEHGRVALCVAALPTAVSVGVEWMGGGSPLLTRTLTALPAGAMAGALVGLALASLGRGRVSAIPPQPSATLP